MVITSLIFLFLICRLGNYIVWLWSVYTWRKLRSVFPKILFAIWLELVKRGTCLGLGRRSEAEFIPFRRPARCDVVVNECGNAWQCQCALAILTPQLTLLAGGWLWRPTAVAGQQPSAWLWTHKSRSYSYREATDSQKTNPLVAQR